METKRCSKCKKVQPVSEFAKKPESKSGYSSHCKSCKREYSAKQRNTTKGIYQTIKGRVKFIKNHPEQYRRCGKVKNVLISEKDFIDWYDHAPRVCVYCDLEERNFRKINDGHINKVKRLTIDCKNNDLGYSKGNLVLACLRCNSIKADIFSFDEMRDIAQKHIKPKWEKQLQESS